MKRAFCVLIIFFVLVTLALETTAAEGRLTGTDFCNEPNSMIVYVGENGLINYIQATFNPGEGYMVRYGIEIADKPDEIHGIGIVKSDRIIQTGPENFTVKGYLTFPVDIAFEEGAVLLILGSETYRISKPKDYLVEIWPHDAEGKTDPSRRFAYLLTKNRSYGFIGIIDKSYIPDYSHPLRDDLDPGTIYFPQNFSFDGKMQTVDVYQIGKKDGPCLGYEYALDLSKDPMINRQNYLILLTQRRGDTLAFPLIHAVLLTIYFYEAMMP